VNAIDLRSSPDMTLLAGTPRQGVTLLVGSSRQGVTHEQNTSNQTPWHALISDAAQVNVEWVEPMATLATKFASSNFKGSAQDASSLAYGGETHSLVGIVLQRHDRARVPTPCASKALHTWLTLPGAQAIDISSIRALAKTLSLMSNSPVRLRNAAERVMVDTYCPPDALAFPKLMYQAQLAVQRHPLLLKSLLQGLMIMAMHPYLDGNGRAARMYWVSGLLAFGFTPVQIGQAFQQFYGPHRRSHLLYTACACAGGSTSPFLRHWQRILQTLS
jgi:hypothetical protein